MSHSRRAFVLGWALPAAVLLAGCGDDNEAPATTTTTTASDGTDLPDQVVEDERCDPAAALISDDAYELVTVLSGVDVGNGQGPGDDVTCTFAQVRPSDDIHAPSVRIFDVSGSGVATEKPAT